MKLYTEGAPELAPEWTASNVDRDGTFQPMYRGNGAQRGFAKVETEDGFPVASVPHLPYEKWLDLSGGQANLVVGTNRDPELPDPAYKENKRRSRAAIGWVPYDYYTARQYTPEMVGNRTEAEWPVRLAEIAKKYKAQHAKREARNEKLARSEIKQLMDTIREDSTAKVAAEGKRK